jgi:hypothetical protein
MLVRVSPSQIATWRGCCRKWAYSRCRSRTENTYAIFGQAVHKVLEAWLQWGVIPNLLDPHGACAMAGLHFLPMPPQPGVEHGFEFLFDGVLYNGRIDLLSGFVARRHIVVTDHKSTGDLKWAKEPDELQDDPQWITYGYYAAHALDVDLVIGQWVYYRRGKPKAIDTTIAETRAILTQRFLRQHHLHVLPLAASRRCMPANDGPERERWIDLHPRVADAGHRDSECRKYGGCPYFHECLNPMQRMTAAIAA